MPNIQIQIVTHNSKKHLDALFRGIAEQEGVGFDVMVIDNASTDGTLEWLEKYKGSLDSRVHSLGMTVVKNQDNRGFARAHNQGFAECQAPYVLVLNPDVEMQAGCLAEMVRVMESEPLLGKGGENRVAAVTPKTYKTLPSNQKSGIIDSLGIKLLPWGQVVNRGEDKAENAKLSPTEKVWGVSGACALYRIKALESVKDKYGIYDERFWMYKEDADLSWRLNRTGFALILASHAVALHVRSVGKGGRDSRPAWVKKESYKNHLLMLKKNLSLRDWWRMPLIIIYELLKFIYVPLLRL